MKKEFSLLLVAVIAMGCVSVPPPPDPYEGLYGIERGAAVLSSINESYPDEYEAMAWCLDDRETGFITLYNRFRNLIIGQSQQSILDNIAEISLLDITLEEGLIRYASYRLWYINKMPLSEDYWMEDRDGIISLMDTIGGFAYRYQHVASQVRSTLNAYNLAYGLENISRKYLLGEDIEVHLLDEGVDRYWRNKYK
jgi:hypothetical protein